MRKLLVGFLLGVVVACVVTPRLGKTLVKETSVLRDTLVFRDTVTIERPRLVVQRKIDTIAYVKRYCDTIRQTDTIYLPRIQREYANESYRAWVSGYEPALDSIRIYPQREIVTCRDKPKRWGVGITAGYGLSPQGLTPYIGIGISYSLFQW